MKKILIVDDEPAIVKLLAYNFKQVDYEVASVGDGKQALDLITNNHYDVVLLDLMLPGMSGEEVLKRLKQANNSTPVLLITAKDNDFDRIFGLEMGADDYIAKPFNPREVIARVNAVLRRTNQIDNQKETGSWPFKLIADQFMILLNDQPLKLTPKEYEILKYFIEHENQVITRDQLLETVWGYDFGGQSRMVDIQIAHLREKIEVNSKSPQYLKTVRGFGYVFSTKE